MARGNMSSLEEWQNNDIANASSFGSLLFMWNNEYSKAVIIHAW